MNDKINIRVADESDAPAILKIYAPYVEKTAVSFEYATPSESEFAERIRRTKKRYPYLAAECDGEIVGYCYAAPFKERAAYDWAVETTIYIKSGMKRRGIGRMLYSALESALKKQGILSMNACVAYTNGADPYLTSDSVLFHERMGFKTAAHFHKCGQKFGRWYDVVWLERHIGKHRENQLPVVPFCEIEDMVSKSL